MTGERDGAWRRPAHVEGSRRVIAVVGAVGQAYALTLLVGHWEVSETPGLSLACWSALCAWVLVAVRVGSRAGVHVTVLLAAGVIGADVVVPTLLPASERSAAWCWGAGALLLLALSALRPLVEVLLLAGVHAWVAALWVLTDGSATGPTAKDIILIGTCVIPSLAAAQFVHGYVGMLARREAAERSRREAVARREADAQVATEVADRVSRLRSDVRPLLVAVADGAPLPLDAGGRRRAADLADQLRRDLLDRQQHSDRPAQ